MQKKVREFKQWGGSQSDQVHVEGHTKATRVILRDTRVNSLDNLDPFSPVVDID